MKRRQAIERRVDGPSLGLVTRPPENLTAKNKARAASAAKNVRFSDGMAMAAGGVERLVPEYANVDSPVNLIHQSNLVRPSNAGRIPIMVGSERSLYVARRRTSQDLCPAIAAGGGVCSASFAAVGDLGRNTADVESVYNLLKLWGPDQIILLGDLVYTGGNTESFDPPNPVADYEALVAKYLNEYIGGYVGMYGSPNPRFNRVWPTPGNHDHTDPLGGFADYTDFFQLPGNERYYSFKFGPVHFIMYHSYLAGEPDGIALGSTQADWLEDQLTNSDCPWRIVCTHYAPYTSDVTHNPGLATIRLPFYDWGASLVINGHGHQFEHCREGGLDYFTVGTGGGGLRGVTSPPIAQSVKTITGTLGAFRGWANENTLDLAFHDVSNTSLYSLTLKQPKTDLTLCYLGDAAFKDESDGSPSAAVAFFVEPATGTAELGKSWPFRAYATLASGVTVDVTDEATWSVDDPTVASINTGLATALNPGTVTVTATYGAFSDTATFTAVVSCIDDPIDVVLVLDASGSMSSRLSSVFSRWYWLTVATRQLVNASAPEDQLAIIPFADQAMIYGSQRLTFDRASILEQFQHVRPRGATNIGAGLTAAYEELNSVRRREDAKGFIVLLSDGEPTRGMTNSQISSYASAIKASGISIITLALSYDLSAPQVAQMAAWASPGLAFQALTAGQLVQHFSSLSRLICSGGYGETGHGGVGYS